MYVAKGTFINAFVWRFVSMLPGADAYNIHPESVSSCGTKHSLECQTVIINRNIGRRIGQN